MDQPVNTPNYHQNRSAQQSKAVALVAFILLLGLAFGYWYGKKVNEAKQASENAVDLMASGLVEPSPTQAVLKTYTDAKGKYSFQYPSSYTLNVDHVFGVDGVNASSPGSVQLISGPLADGESSFSMTITTKDIPLSYKGFIPALFGLSMQSIKSYEKPFQAGDISGYIYTDTPVGPYGSTYVFDAGPSGKAYQFMIETAAYMPVEAEVKAVLSTFKHLN